jgi:predicted AAA+ superfamily ATPase
MRLTNVLSNYSFSIEAEKELGMARKLILTREVSYSEEGIEIQPLWKWLLNQ